MADGQENDQGYYCVLSTVPDIVPAAVLATAAVAVDGVDGGVAVVEQERRAHGLVQDK